MCDVIILFLITQLIVCEMCGIIIIPVCVTIILSQMDNMTGGDSYLWRQTCRIVWFLHFIFYLFIWQTVFMICLFINPKQLTIQTECSPAVSSWFCWSDSSHADFNSKHISERMARWIWKQFISKLLAGKCLESQKQAFSSLCHYQSPVKASSFISVILHHKYTAINGMEEHARRIIFMNRSWTAWKKLGTILVRFSHWSHQNAGRS